MAFLGVRRDKPSRLGIKEAYKKGKRIHLGPKSCGNSHRLFALVIVGRTDRGSDHEYFPSAHSLRLVGRPTDRPPTA
jgi:hypothetical protein